jgi:hypothetical protein
MGMQMMSWSQQMKEQMLREKQLEQELQMGNLKMSAQRMMNEANQAEFGEWKDTAGMRAQMLEQKASYGEGQAREAQARAKLAENDANRIPLANASEDQLRKAAKAKAMEDLEGQRLDNHTRQLKLALILPQYEDGVMQLQQQMIESKTRTATYEQQIKDGGFTQTMQQIAAGIKASQSTTPEQFDMIKENLPPEMGMFKMIPSGIKEPGKAMDAIMNTIAQRAADGDPDALQTVAFMTASEMTRGQGLSRIVNPGQFNEREVNDMQAAIDKVLPALTSAFKKDTTTPRLRNLGGDTTPRKSNLLSNQPQIDVTPPAAQGGAAAFQSSPTQIAADQLPKEFLPAWSHIQKYPKESSMQFLDAKKLNDKGWNQFYREIPKEPWARDLMDPSFYESTTSRDKLANSPSEDWLKRGGSKNERFGILEDKADRDIFNQLTSYDRAATGQQHVMYMSLMRELAKARKNKDDGKAQELLGGFYRAVGPNFLTKVQFDSLAELERRYGW